MKLIIASNNKHKIIEIKTMIGEWFDDVLSQSEAGFFDDVEETGATFAENSYIKANAISDKFPDCAVIADDSGLMVDALDGAPGVYSARYCGVHGNDKANNDLLLKNMSGKNPRTARFVSAITLIMPDGKLFQTEGKVEGEILFEERGTGGFGYDPLFLSIELNKTFGEATASEKNTISHRARALENLRKLLFAQKNCH